jgi:hypothetical protein
VTATVSETSLDVPVDVRFTAAGAPLAIRYDGRVRAVATEPVHWFARDSWWETQRTAPVGVGNVVDIEHWRVQVRLICPHRGFPAT